MAHRQNPDHVGPIPTVPCQYFGTFQGCTRGKNCTFLHADGSEFSHNYRNVYSPFYVVPATHPDAYPSRGAKYCVRYRVQEIGDNQARFRQDRTVYFQSAFDATVAMENSTKKYLIDLVSDSAVGDDWTGGHPPTDPRFYENITTYLKFTWVRQLEEGKVLCCRIPNNTPARDFAESRGISEYFLAWNSGLTNRAGQDVFFLAVQQSSFMLPPAFILLKSGIYTGSLPSELLGGTEPLSLTMQPFETSPPRPRFVPPRDPSLLFDDEALVSPDVAHMMENAARFLEVGVMDEAEFILGDGRTRLDNATWPAPNDRRYQLSDGRYLALLAPGSTMPFFRRNRFGMRSFQYLLTQWKDEAVARCRRTRGLVVPQFYYREVNGFYRGELQLLLPLYCGTSSVKLALTLAFERRPENVDDGRVDEYWYVAKTVLMREWARGNARLLSCPQVHWINEN